MKKAILAALLLSGCAVAAPKLPVEGPLVSKEANCPDGSTMVMDIYDLPDGPLVLFKRAKGLVGLQNVAKQELYVYSERKTYPMAEAVKKYPTPCELVVAEGI